MTASPRLRGRQALLAVALAAMLVTAGCTGILDSGGDGAGSGAQLDSVPNDAEFVGYVDASGMVGDDSLRSLANTALETQAETSPYYEGPESVSEMLDEAEAESGLSPEKFNDVTFFGTSGDQVATNAEQAGMIVTTEFSAEELVSSMEDEGTELTEETYGDTTVYTYGYENQNALAVLGDGTFALGDVAAVESVVDVRAGDADALAGDLRSAYENTDDGYVRFAMNVPQEDIPSEELGEGSPIDTSAFNTVRFVSGSFSTSGDSVTANVNMVSESSDDASRTADLVDGALSLYSGVGNEEIRTTLEKISVSQNGDTTTVSFTDSVENLEDLVETMYTMNTGASASASGSASASNSSDA
ncbi:hypothetical protein [Halobacterium wangiae]|uniref:hypothetical protein n=1 Tax=Halobacterium wangiae TaxID=2902623 RepID=UPI001E2A9FAA|nr:hypothetical protein [Halobacterium wangiae]